MNLLFVIIPQLAWTLSGQSYARTLLLSAQFVFLALTSKFLKWNIGRRFVFTYNDASFALVLYSTVDIAALREIFLFREYEWVPVPAPKTIIDLGAHFGDTAVYYHLRYPEAKIWAIEPSPESFKRLLENVHSIENIIPVHAAIGDHDGEAVLHLSRSSLGNSLSVRQGERGTVTVPLFTLDTLVQRYSIPRADIIKFDIEGGEQFLFGAHDPATFARAYIGEVHGDLMTIPVSEFTDHFKGAFTLESVLLPGHSRSMVRAVAVQ